MANIVSPEPAADQRSAPARTAPRAGTDRTACRHGPHRVPAHAAGPEPGSGCWAIIVVAEEINAQSGLGYLIMQAQTTNRTDIMCLGLAIYAILGLIADGIVRLPERYLLVWRRGFKGA